MATRRSLFRASRERRIAPRHPCRPGTVARVLAPWADGPWPAAVRNISATGICLLLRVRIPPASLVTVELTSPDQEFARRLLVQMRYSDICWPNDTWLHGCAFLRPLRPEELELLT